MLEDLVENEHISCKVLRYNLNIKIECQIKEELLDNKIYYYAANTPDRLNAFSGSGFPFHSKEAAFEGTPNIGRLGVKDNKVIIKLLRPNSYYNEKYELIEPEVIIKYILKDGQTRVLNVPIDNKIPYRNLLQTKYKSKETKIETQEKILLRNQYPDILI